MTYGGRQLPTPCPVCGEPMTGGTALVMLTSGSCAPLSLPFICGSDQCKAARAARTEALIAEMIARGVIDP